MRITKVYTKTGDRGTTQLVGGKQVAKDSIRVEAYGAVDELNASVGLVRTLLIEDPHPANETLEPVLERIQHDLFDLGAALATPSDSKFQPPGVAKGATSALETSLDGLNEGLPPLEDFMLPGGGLIGAHFHMARTICRRAERRVVTLTAAEPDTDAQSVIYLNRLSDWLFVAGRWASSARKERELIWRHDLPR